MFWPCGITAVQVVETFEMKFAIGHSPGHMYVSDILADDLKIKNIE